MILAIGLMSCQVMINSSEEDNLNKSQEANSYRISNLEKAPDYHHWLGNDAETSESDNTDSGTDNYTDSGATHSNGGWSCRWDMGTQCQDNTDPAVCLTYPMSGLVMAPCDLTGSSGGCLVDGVITWNYPLGRVPVTAAMQQVVATDCSNLNGQYININY